MSKIRVLNADISDAPTAASLREHAEDRHQLLEELTAAFQADECIRAVWLWGSFGRGEADDLSDLDLWVAVPDELVSEMGVRLLDCLHQAGLLISALENAYNAPAGGGYLGCLFAGRHGMLPVDLYWQGLSTVDNIPDVSVLLQGLPDASREMALVFSRRNDPAPPVSLELVSKTAVDQPDLHMTLEKQLAFVYLMLSIAAKYLARDPSSDLKLILYPKPAFEEAVDLMDAGEIIGLVDWSIPNDALGKITRLKHIADKAKLLIRRMQTRGIAISPYYASRLDRYLEMVENIILFAHEH